MERLYATYKDHIEFLIVYIREAHPEMLQEGNETGIVGRPKTFDERLILATECVSKYKFTMPMVIDGMEGRVNGDYQAAPVRTTITDIDGRVAYYAGPGPFDFRLSKVESVCRKLVAHNGRMPPPPDPRWGETVNGLRCGLTFDPPWLKIGEEVSVKVKLENVSEDLLELYFDPADAAEHLELVNDQGQKLKLEPSGGMRMFSRMMRRNQRNRPVRPRRLALGDFHETEIEGRIVAPESGMAGAGTYRAVFDFEVSEESLAAMENISTEDAWRGRLESGAFPFELTLEPERACADCHGVEDYHHEQEENCAICHIGEEGTQDFKVNEKACSQCHPRQGVQGRRRILGPGGEFSLASVHLPGKIEDGHCLRCHDHGRHRMGAVTLVDPRTDGSEPWTGTMKDFCLSCHNGNPPAYVVFPMPNGSGYDKSRTACKAPSAAGQDCTNCHASHGSMTRPLLKEKDGDASPPQR